MLRMRSASLALCLAAAVASAAEPGRRLARPADAPAAAPTLAPAAAPSAVIDASPRNPGRDGEGPGPAWLWVVLGVVAVSAFTAGAVVVAQPHPREPTLGTVNFR